MIFRWTICNVEYPLEHLSLANLGLVPNVRKMLGVLPTMVAGVCPRTGANAHRLIQTTHEQRAASCVRR